MVNTELMTLYGIIDTSSVRYAFKLKSMRVMLASALMWTTVGAANNQPPQLFWFYQPPSNISLNALAEKFDVYVLSKGDEAARDALLDLGEKPEQFAIYLTSDAVNDPCRGRCPCDKRPLRNNAAWKIGDICELKDNHPDWFLRDKDGDLVSLKRGVWGYTFYWMDPGNQGWREFFLRRARELLTITGYDELHLDNIDASLFRFTREDVVLRDYPDDRGWQAATIEFLRFLQDRHFGDSEQTVVANITGHPGDVVGIWGDYLAYLDGTMDEGFAVSWATGYVSRRYWETSMRKAELTIASGKKTLLVSQGSEDAHHHQTFAYASYLLLADHNVYFRYTDSQDYHSDWAFDNYLLNLGVPRGGRYLDDGIWRRKFSNGAVWVDPVAHESGIEIHDDGGAGIDQRQADSGDALEKVPD